MKYFEVIINKNIDYYYNNATMIKNALEKIELKYYR